MSARSLPMLLASALAATFLLGCQLAPYSEKPAPFGSLAQISAISPDTTQVLRVGAQTKLRVGVSYALSTESGTLTLLVLAADNAVVARDVKMIAKGSGTATLEADFTVPRTTIVRVFTTLTVQGQDSTSAVDGRSFEVVAR